jgi:hypothetical protein
MMESYMSRRLNWEKANLDRRPKLSIKEFIDGGYTAIWLERAERREAIHAEIRNKKRGQQKLMPDRKR